MKTENVSTVNISFEFFLFSIITWETFDTKFYFILHDIFLFDFIEKKNNYLCGILMPPSAAPFKAPKILAPVDVRAKPTSK